MLALCHFSPTPLSSNRMHITHSGYLGRAEQGGVVDGQYVAILCVSGALSLSLAHCPVCVHVWRHMGHGGSLHVVPLFR